MNEPLAVEVRGVTKAFRHGSVVAVDDVSLAIERGAFVSLIGPSGCGKSTVLRLIANLTEPTHGTVTSMASPPSRPGPGLRHGVPVRWAV